jgi:hypothetical protein
MYLYGIIINLTIRRGARKIMKTLSNEIIRKLKPCYDPAKIGIPENEELSVIDFVTKYRNTVNSPNDIIWLLCRPEFMSEKDMRLFAVWCAREALKLVEDPDPRSIEACNVAERYADGEATKEELSEAWSATCKTARDVADYEARYAAWSSARDAARDVTLYDARYAANSAARYAINSATSTDASNAQIDKLLTYFK